MKTQIWSCGGGVQSCAIGALIVSGKLPVPDLALIVDTERERSSTWAYFDAVLHPRLMDVGLDIKRVKKSEFSDVDLFGGADDDTFLPGGYHAGGKTPMYCSNEWKTFVARRWIRAQGVKECNLWMGMSCDEMSRVRISGLQWLEHRFPLIELEMRRSSCVKAVLDLGWPMPPRSSCWLCPNATNREWLALKKDWPEDFQKAVQLERDARIIDPGMTLHSSGKTLDQVDFNENQLTLFENTCAGMCWV